LRRFFLRIDQASPKRIALFPKMLNGSAFYAGGRVMEPLVKQDTCDW
jgi:hypothetical protein